MRNLLRLCTVRAPLCWLCLLGLELVACSDDKGLNDGTSKAGPGATATTSAQATASQTAANPSTPTATTVSVKFGAECKVDVDCDVGQFCLKDGSAIFGGTIAGGLCTLDCSKDQNACGATGVDSYCVGNADGSSAVCIPGCTIGSATVACLGRSELACVPVNLKFTDAACVPLCQSNATCGTGLACEPLFLDIDDNNYVQPYGGVCISADSVSADQKPDGAVCQTSDDCLGFCNHPTAGNTEGYCTSLCNFTGDNFACHAAPDGAIDALCLDTALPNSTSDFPQNELGLCRPSCDADTECHGGQTCVLLTNEDLIKTLGHKGLCGEPTTSTSSGTTSTPSTMPADKLGATPSTNSSSLRRAFLEHAPEIQPLSVQLRLDETRRVTDTRVNSLHLNSLHLNNAARSRAAF